MGEVMSRWRSVARRAWFEVVLFGLAVGWVVALPGAVERGTLLPLLGACAVALAGSAAGAGVLWRTGELQLAWHCPRLDRLQLRVESADLPWQALRSADAVLEALQGAGEGRAAFLTGARLELLKAASRVIAAHRLARRARAALKGAPEGQGRRRLLLQAQRAEAELLGLTEVLKDLRARMLAAALPASQAEDSSSSLEALAGRVDALAQAVSPSEEDDVVTMERARV